MPNKIQKISIKGNLYDIDVAKNWSENNPSAVGFIKDRTHNIPDEYAIKFSLPILQDGKYIWYYTFPEALTPGNYWLFRTEIDKNGIPRNKGCWVTISEVATDHTVPYLNCFFGADISTTTFNLGEATSGEISDQTAANNAVKANPIQFFIIADEQVNKLSNAYLNIDYANDEVRTNAKLASAAKVEALDGKYDTAINTIRDTINALDYSDTAVTNNFVTAVSQTNGEIKVTRARPTIDNINGLSSKLASIEQVINENETDIEQKVSDLDNAIGNLSNIMNFRGAFTAKNNCSDPIKGDVIIITSGTDAGKEFVYDGTTWEEIGDTTAEKAAISALQTDTSKLRADLDNISLVAEKVYFENDLVFTEAFGKYVPDATGTVTIETASKDMSLADLLNNAFATDKQPEVVQPTIAITPSVVYQPAAGTTAMGEVEIGTFATVSYRVSSLTWGSYPYGSNGSKNNTATNVSWISHTGNLDGKSKTSTDFNTSVTFNAFQVGGGSYSLNVTGAHSAGFSTPYTALGNPAADKAIKANSEVAATGGGTITGVRYMFMGTMPSKPTTLTSTDIRALTSVKRKAAKGTFDVAVTAGARRAIIAVPIDRTLSKVLDVNDANNNITEAFTKNATIVSVQGANSSFTKDYNVYYMDYGTPAVANTLKVTIS